MENYYQTLGVDEKATDDDIKKAYRKLAKDHHPDKGGDTKHFQKITEAYNTLKDQKSRQEYDMKRQFGGNPFGHGNPFTSHDIFSDIFGPGFNPHGFTTGAHHRYPRNQDIQIGVNLTLEEILTGKLFEADISLPSGKTEHIKTNIPPGVSSGDVIKLAGMGDDSYQGPRGSILLVVNELFHRIFKRNGRDLIIEKEINVLDLILGTTIDVESIDTRKLSIKIPAGTQVFKIFSCPGHGLPSYQQPARGNLLVRLIPVVPEIKDIDTINTLINIKEKYTKGEK